METREETPKPEGEGTPPGWRPPAYLVAVAGFVVLIAIVGLALFRRNAPPGGAAGGHAVVAEPEPGPLLSETIEVHPLTPRARILLERYRCVCGCDMPLSTCTCQNTPGSVDMKAYVQKLVDEGLSSEEIDRRMIEKYGELAILSHPSHPSPDSGR